MPAQRYNSMYAYYQLTPADILPTGNGELIMRQANGWALVHP